MRNFVSAIEKQLEQEQQELECAEDITLIIFPTIDQLKKNEILNPVVLKTKLSKLPPEYRDSVYGLCRIATDAGPEGSIVILDPEKVFLLIEDIDLEEENLETSDEFREIEFTEGHWIKKRQPKGEKNKSSKKHIVGFNKRIAGVIINLVNGKLSALCHLVNDLIFNKIVNTPSIINIKVKLRAASPLNDKKTSQQK